MRRVLCECCLVFVAIYTMYEFNILHSVHTMYERVQFERTFGNCLRLTDRSESLRTMSFAHRMRNIWMVSWIKLVYNADFG